MSDLDDFQRKADVSRETLEHLQNYARLIKAWNKRINLVSAKSLETLWTRHFLDSAQLHAISPQFRNWADLGSGGGFPGAVVAIMADNGKHSILIESDQRKAAFLRTVARETTGFKVISERIEQAEPQAADVVSARALAPLPVLLGLVARHLAPGGRALLPKGKNVGIEMTEALEHWRFDCETYPSKTDEDAVILSIGEIERD